VTAATPGWDITFLRPAVLTTAAVAGTAAALFGLFAGWAQAAGILTGAGVVAAFFCLSAWIISRAGRIDDGLTLPAAVATFLVKALVFFALLQLVPVDGVPDRQATAWAVIFGTGVWTGVHIRWVLTRKLYYVTPPEPPGSRATDPALHPPGPPPSDPEKPTTRG
jgi:ATP synthase protein I